MTGVMMMIVIVIIIPSISDDGNDIRGNIYIHSKGMKLNASSCVRFLTRTTGKLSRPLQGCRRSLGADHILLVCCKRLEWVKVATRIQLHVWTRINNNQTYTTL
jgi:hypothetical protein